MTENPSKQEERTTYCTSTSIFLLGEDSACLFEENFRSRRPRRRRQFDIGRKQIGDPTTRTVPPEENDGGQRREEEKERRDRKEEEEGEGEERALVFLGVLAVSSSSRSTGYPDGNMMKGTAKQIKKKKNEEKGEEGRRGGGRTELRT